MPPFQLTVAIDFDGVIHSYKSRWTTPEEIHDGPTKGAREAIEKYLEAGFKVVIYTTRVSERDEGSPRFQSAPGAALAAVKNWLRKYDFPELEVTATKPVAALYIDDRGYLFTGDNWPSIEYIEKFCPWNRMRKLPEGPTT